MLGGIDNEASVVARQVSLEETVGIVEDADAGGTELLGQAALQGPIGTFTAAAGLRGVGRDQLDAAARP